MQYLVDNRFSLVTFYQFHEYGGVANWADALFVNLDFSQNRSERLESATAPVGLATARDPRSGQVG